MTTRRRILAFAGLIASVALVWSATAGVLWNADTPEVLADARFSAAERLIFYRVGPHRTLSLSLPAGIQAVRLTTHLELARGAEYAPDRQYVYGMTARVLDEHGQEVSRQPLFTRTRQSKADLQRGGWAKEASFTTRADQQIADERQFLFSPPTALHGRPATLQLTFDGEDGALLVRAYGQSANGEPPLLASRRRALVERAEARISRATFLPWEKLPWDAQHRIMSARWDRVDAVGEPGHDFETLAVYETDFRLPLLQVQDERQERLSAHRAVAVNVVGPAQLNVWLWNPAPQSSVLAGPVSVTLLSEKGVRTQSEVAITRAEPLRQTVDVPSGLHTVSVTNVGGAELRFTIEGPSFAWLAPDALKTRAEGGLTALVPDVRRYDAWAQGPACAPLELDVAKEAPAGARLLRVDARLLGEARANGDVKVELLDDQGQTLTATSITASNAPALFESADLPFQTVRKLPCSTEQAASPGAVLDVTDVPLDVSEVATGRIFLPRGTAKVRITASQPTALSLYEFLAPPDGPVQPPPYAGFELTGVRFRHAPWSPGAWHPVRPSNHAELADAGAALQLLSQVRLEPSDVAQAPPPSGEPLVLVPTGLPPSRELLEEDLPDQDARAAAQAAYTRLTANQRVKLVFDERTAKRPELRLDVDDEAALGQEATLVLDGRPLRRFRMRTTQDRALLPPVAPGLHEVELSTEAPGVFALLNRAPAPGQAVRPLRTRTVYRLQRELTVNVPKPKARGVTLNIVLYGRTPEATATEALRIRVDGGAPERAYGVLLPALTRADRTVPLPATDRAPASAVGDRGVKLYPRTVFIRLGEDLSEGVHKVRVESLGGEPLWARFFIYGEDPGNVDVRQWNREGWEELP